MKLNKEICIKCCKKNNIVWSKEDEKRWERKKVILCPEECRFIECPYKIEHTNIEHTNSMNIERFYKEFKI
jgi:hypothetical protein